MRGFWGILLLLLLVSPLAADERQNVRVLYCGDPGSIRETDFHAFLARHFTRVTLRDLHEFREQDANEHDVVIFDWSYLYDGKGGFDEKKQERLRTLHQKHQLPSLSRKFSRPAILVAQTGGAVSQPLKLKIDWLCLCLTGPAHHLRLKHPLFHTPLEVAPKLEEVPTPENYPYLTIDPALGPTMQVWNLQTKNYPEIDPGLVSTLYGFADSPDAEVIAQGFAMKGPDTLTLGRQANFFLWGFSAPPADMTPAAQRLFVNAVCYMRQFDGQTPLVRSESKARDWALRWAATPRYFLGDFEPRKTQMLRAMYKQHPEWIPKEHVRNLDTYILEQVKQTQEQNKSWMEQVLPEDLRKKFGLDADKYAAYYKENFEFLYPKGERPTQFVIDEDVKAVGPSNRRVELLDRCVTKLEKKQRADLALRLLKRYTKENFETAPQWRKWLDQNRSRLFFSDVGGYKFFVGPAVNSSGQNRLQTKS